MTCIYSIYISSGIYYRPRQLVCRYGGLHWEIGKLWTNCLFAEYSSWRKNIYVCIWTMILLNENKISANSSSFGLMHLLFTKYHSLILFVILVFLKVSIHSTTVCQVSGKTYIYMYILHKKLHYISLMVHERVFVIAVLNALLSNMLLWTVS